MKVMITRPGYRCERCGHEWIARGRREPRICARCKRPLDDTAATNGDPRTRRIDHEFWHPLTFEELKERQGVKPFNWDESEPAGFWPDDFDLDEFIRETYEYRRQSRA